MSEAGFETAGTNDAVSGVVVVGAASTELLHCTFRWRRRRRIGGHHRVMPGGHRGERGDRPDATRCSFVKLNAFAARCLSLSFS